MKKKNRKGRKMNDQISVTMADVQTELDKAKKEAADKQEVFVQTPTDVGSEEKPIE